jgi:hypothetical protein
MITIADALIFALLAGIAVLLWKDRYRLEMLEEENDELWDMLGDLADAHNEVAEGLGNIYNAAAQQNKDD